MAGHHITGKDQQHAVEGLRRARQALQGDGPLPASAYYRRAARHIAAAGALYHDSNHVLLVQPAHRPSRWQLPGGAANHDEAPHHTARREVLEELGLRLSPSAPLLVIDWVPGDPTTDRPPLAVYVFDGGHLTVNQARQRIHLQADELLDWRYANPDGWPDLLAEHAQRRLHACLHARDTGRAAYLHHGWPPGAARDNGDGPL